MSIRIVVGLASVWFAGTAALGGFSPTGKVSSAVLFAAVPAQQPPPGGREGQGRGDAGRGGRAGGGGGGQQKADNLPAGLFAEKRYATMPTQRHEWVDIPLGATKLHTWISYPPGDGKAGVVIVMQHETGLDDWMRAAADQVAHDGFIAVAPDLFSGLAPGGGNVEAFSYPDDAIKANAKLTPAETLRRYKAVREYALKLPRANGKSASLGFSVGGLNSFRLAADVPDLNAAVVFYGTAPDEATMAKIKAPVLALYGEHDQAVGATVQTTSDTMKRLGKSFESHVYPRATNFFLVYQDMAANGPATNDAWPRAMAFLKQSLQ